MQEKFVIHNLLIILQIACMLSLTPTPAPGGWESRIPLEINEDFKPKILYAAIMFTNSKGEKDYTLPAGINNTLGEAPGGVAVRIERTKELAIAHHIQVDTDGDGDVDEETVHTVAADSSFVAQVIRKWADGKQRFLPYQIKYSASSDRDTPLREIFYWSSHYRAEGKVKINDCESLLGVMDMNGDGQFDGKDFAAGTCIGLDRNGDGKFYGADEWLLAEQIIEYCGETLLIESIEADGSAITLVKTTLSIPKLGGPLPAFSLVTIKGDTIYSSQLKGKLHLLDF